MPIKPENRALYPSNWPAISLAARERARWTCQHLGCLAKQCSVGFWRCELGVWTWCPVEGNRPTVTRQDRAFHMAGEGRRVDGTEWTYSEARAFVAHWAWSEGKPTVIVLTVAHLNHDPRDCRPENLAAMCQRHHLAYDQAHHIGNAYMTRRARANTIELPF